MHEVIDYGLGGAILLWLSRNGYDFVMKIRNGRTNGGGNALTRESYRQLTNETMIPVLSSLKDIRDGINKLVWYAENPKR